MVEPAGVWLLKRTLFYQKPCADYTERAAKRFGRSPATLYRALARAQCLFQEEIHTLCPDFEPLNGGQP